MGIIACSGCPYQYEQACLAGKYDYCQVERQKPISKEQHELDMRNRTHRINEANKRAARRNKDSNILRSG